MQNVPVAHFQIYLFSCFDYIMIARSTYEYSLAVLYSNLYFTHYSATMQVFISGQFSLGMLQILVSWNNNNIA